MKSRSYKIDQLEESQTLALTSLARRLKAEGVDVLSLTAGEPDFPTPEHIKQAAIQAIQENFTRYTANEGIPELLQAIVKKFREDNNLHFEPSQIVVSTGAKHSLFNSLQALCNPGDEVIIPSPYWVSYPEMVKLVDAIPIVIRSTHESSFKITARQLREAVTAKTKAFIFNSPSNPTGAVYTQQEMEELAEVVAETGIYVVSDEIYEKVIYDGAKHFSIGSINRIKDHVVTVNGVSKAYSMTG
ncbi:MAG: pyridoxal phosphate-dependent aminotransferase, partial [Bacteroidetes bacterium]